MFYDLTSTQWLLLTAKLNSARAALACAADEAHDRGDYFSVKAYEQTMDELADLACAA